MPVAQLHLGMHVLQADGNIGIVTGWRIVSGTKVMYNLTVAKDHTYTVGAGQWVVHNTCPFAPGAEQHILEGSRGGGYHWEGDSTTPGEVVPGTETAPDAHGVYEAKVDVNGVRKTGNGGVSSFFPRSMSRADVLKSIDEAYNNRLWLGGNTWAGETSSGMVVQMTLNGSGQIISAYPWYEPGSP